MAFDGIVLAAVTKELQVLIGCRIEKIYQPEASCLVLHLLIAIIKLNYFCLLTQ